MEYRGNRRYYSINYDTLDLLISHLDYLRLGQNDLPAESPEED